MSSSLPDRLIEIEPVEVPAARRAPAGTSKTFRAYVPGQVMLMPEDSREWVPDGDFAHFVGDLVEEVLHRERTATAGPPAADGEQQQRVAQQRVQRPSQYERHLRLHPHVRDCRLGSEIHPDITVADLYLLFTTAPSDRPAEDRARWLELALRALTA